MESSQVFGGAEECQSSESGWTMYIGSPIYGDDDDDDNDDSDDDDNSDEDGYQGKITVNNHGDDSDDSMASDASSGPSHRENSWVNKDDQKHNSTKKAKSSSVEIKIRGDQRKKGEKEESLSTAKGKNFSIQSGDKARKNSWIGKRK